MTAPTSSKLRAQLGQGVLLSGRSHYRLRREPGCISRVAHALVQLALGRTRTFFRGRRPATWFLAEAIRSVGTESAPESQYAAARAMVEDWEGGVHGDRYWPGS